MLELGPHPTDRCDSFTKESFPPLDILRAAISDNPPYCSGVCSVPAEQCVLFYSKEAGESASRINLSKASVSQLEHLSEACEPATFGIDQKDVLDESYRKAGKLDTIHFASKFDLWHSGLMDVIRSALLEGHDENKMIDAELYKLNIYGKDSFFKSHKDTPRGEKMFGSLVIVFPTMHEGGALALRHGGREWIFDSATDLSDQSECSIGYIAFYSNVEHEVQTVKAGYRVTLTYNLYFVTEDSAAVSIAPIPETEFKETLKHLLDDTNFLPEGGNLGFGLRHQYPIKVTEDSDPLIHVIDSLKGSDAVIRKACAELGLDIAIKVIYKDKRRYADRGEVMLDEVVDLTSYGQIDEEITHFLRQEYGGQRVLSGDVASPEMLEYEYKRSRWPESSHIRVWWVTELTRFTSVEGPYVAYGNEATLGYVYGDLCLLVSVGKPGQRAIV